ncbi:MAG: hypothetical protein ACLGHC_05565 [Alphaproteobacteria bacterium]
MSDCWKWLLALFLAMSAPMVHAEPLTIRAGETWVFTVKDGQPIGARKVEAGSKPARGQITASVRAFLGTALTVTNNSATAYTFRAELLRRGKAAAARSCTLPGGARPIFEQWPQRADAVRIGDFRAAGDEGRC